MQRKLIAVSALSASFISGLCAQIAWLSLPVSDPYESKSLQGTVPHDYDLTGYYYPAHEFTWAFDNVIRIDLTTADFRVGADSSVIRTPIAPKGYLITDLDVYKFSSVNIDGGRLSFTTEARLGVTYEFTGRVLEGEYSLQGYSQYYAGKTIMVEGRMVRMLFGFKVAEREVSFTKGSAC